MSLEQNINRIATALELIAERLKDTPVATAAPVAPAPVATPAPAPTPFSVESAAPAPAPAVPQPTASQAPFTDNAGMQEYVKKTYQELGPEKGAKMIEILKELNLNTIKDLKPEQYGPFYAKVEALKAH
jgi:hypothetical protein